MIDNPQMNGRICARTYMLAGMRTSRDCMQLSLTLPYFLIHQKNYLIACVRLYVGMYTTTTTTTAATPVSYTHLTLPTNREV